MDATRACELLIGLPEVKILDVSEPLEDQPERWRDAISWAVLDLSGPWRLAFDTMLPAVSQVADPFHLVKLANQRLDEVRRRVQNETLGHKDDLLRLAQIDLAVACILAIKLIEWADRWSPHPT